MYAHLDSVAVKALCIVSCQWVLAETESDHQNIPVVGDTVNGPCSPSYKL